MKRHRILIIDDNEVWRDHIAQALRLLGHEVGTAASCAEGQALATTMAPELIVIDISLPSLAGLTLIECLTMNGRRSGSAGARPVPPSRIIVLTYERDPRIRAAVRALGVETYLLKSECAAPDVVRCIDAKLMREVPGSGGGGGGAAGGGSAPGAVPSS